MKLYPWKKWLAVLVLVSLATVAWAQSPPYAPASQAEVNAGLNTWKGVTPATLAGYATLTATGGVSAATATNIAKWVMMTDNAYSATNLLYNSRLGSPTTGIRLFEPSSADVGFKGEGTTNFIIYWADDQGVWANKFSGNGEGLTNVVDRAAATNASIYNSLAVTGAGGDGVRLAVRRTAGQANDIFQVQDQSNNRLWSVDASGVAQGSGAGLTNLNGTNIVAKTINTNNLSDAAYVALVGGGSGSVTITNNTDAVGVVTGGGSSYGVGTNQSGISGSGIAIQGGAGNANTFTNPIVRGTLKIEKTGDDSSYWQFLSVGNDIWLTNTANLASFLFRSNGVFTASQISATTASYDVFNVTNAYFIGAATITNAANNVAAASFTNHAATASRLALYDANKKLGSAAASGAVPINADGSASTSAQVAALFPGAPLTNNTATAYVFNASGLTNLDLSISTNALPGNIVIPVLTENFTNLSANITVTGFSGADNTKADWWNLTATNSWTTNITITFPASVSTSTNTFFLGKVLYVTNGSWVTLSGKVAAWGTNAAAVRWTP